jgi:hypothetical protein
MAAGGALASEIFSHVAVFNADGTPAGATVCDFYVEFSAVEGGESGDWELRDSGGAVVEHGTYSVTGSAVDRVPDTGTFSLPNGTYKLVWDNESPIDTSKMTLDIVVECAAPTATPTATPTEAPTFSEDVSGATDVPPRLPTLPNTTTVGQSSGPDQGAWTGVIVAMLALAGLVLVLTPRSRSSRR